MDLQAILEQLVGWHDAYNVAEPTRILKISEESGEVTKAYIGWRGLNPRKGVTNGPEDVMKELGDTILSSCIAMLSLDPDMDLVQYLKEHAQFVGRRVGLDV